MSDVLVLCYHAVSDRWTSPYAVDPDRLDRQISALLRRGYRPATFGEALASPYSGRTVVVTFDDAYRSVIENGVPVLERLGIPATVFACTGLVESDAPMALGLEAPQEELLSASWTELRRLVDAGWEVGSHAHSHGRLTELADAALSEELTVSKAECEQRLGIECTSVAYPFGAVDDRVTAAAHAAGYRQGGGVLGVSKARGQLAWPRVRMTPDDIGLRLRLKRSSLLRRLRASNAWAPFEFLHR